MVPMAFLDLYTSSKLIEEHMKRKKSQHEETLKESFENTIIFKECLMNT
jgi:hypothetical protein